MSWATLDELRALAGDLGVTVSPDDTQATRLLERAQDVCEVWGVRVRLATLDGLSDVQLQALADAACRQALWMVELDEEWLGDSNIASMPNMSFSRDPRPRLSPAALEAPRCMG